MIPSSPKVQVMFFPSDVIRSGLTDLKVGDRISFRPRVEGPTTIASDLTAMQDVSTIEAQPNLQLSSRGQPKDVIQTKTKPATKAI